MKIFVSHSSKDREIVEIIDSLLKRLDVDHWVDFKRITEGTPVPTEIDKGFLDATHFLLVWSKAASESEWVSKETAKANYKKITRIPLLVDDTDESDLPLGFAAPYHRITKANAEFEIKKLLNEIRSELDFQSQVKLLKVTVCDHYKNLPEKPDYPVIKNFRKFDGAKYYVQQGYHDISTNRTGTSVGDYTIQLIKEKLTGLDLILKTKNLLVCAEKKLSKLEANTDGKKYLSLIGDSVDLFEIKKRVLLSLNIANAIFGLVELQELSQLELSRRKARIGRRKNKSSYEQEQINSLEQKINECGQKIAKAKIADKEKLQTTEKMMKEINKILTLKKQIHSLQYKLDRLASENIIPIVGDYGSGKSALLHFLMYEVCREGFEKYIPVFVPMGQLPHRDDLVDSLLTDIYEFVKNEYQFNISDEDFRRKIDEGKIILFLDALDEMSNKLDPNIAQTNLNHAVKLSKTCIIVLTSRHTYFSEAMDNDLLIRHRELIKILDFSKDEIEQYIGLYLGHNKQRMEEIKTTIEEGKLGDFPQKPLFLNVICEKFEELQQYFPINESVILQVLTDGWIKHDVEDNVEGEQLRKQVKNEREMISEILACKTYEKGLPIGIPEITAEVEVELQYVHALAKNRLTEYYKDAINSTFLVREKDEKYRFILNPVREYFVAHRIVGDIKKGNVPSFFKHVNMIKSPEVFDFIRGIIEIEWSIRPHVFDKIPGELRQNDSLRRYENLSNKIYALINDVRNGKYSEKVGNLVKILYMTGNLPPRPDLHGLDLTGLDLVNSNLKGANMNSGTYSEINLRGSNLRDVKLAGAKLIKAKLSGSDLTGADLTGADLTGADLSNADLREANITKTNFTNAILRNANLTSVTAVRTKFVGSNLSFCTLSGGDLSEADSVSGAKFIGVDLQTTKLPTFLSNVNFRDAILIKLTLDRFELSYCDLRDADLTNVRLQWANIKNCDLRWSKIVNADLFKATLIGSKLYGTDLSGTSLQNTDKSGVIWD